MKKAAVASLLAVSALFMFPSMFARTCAAQAQQPAGGVQMDATEFAMYDTAVNKTPDPKAQAPLLEAYLAKYPSSAVKNDVLLRIMIDYSSFDQAKAITAADAVLQVNPNNLQAYIIEVSFRKAAAEALATSNPSGMQAGLDDAAAFAQKGLDAAKQPKPADFTDAQYAQLVAFATPNFYSAIGEAARNKKDGATAVAAYKAEIATFKPDQLTTPAVLQEVFYLGQSYYLSTPPDYTMCAFYTTRAAALAPDQFKPMLQPTANYCYKKQHGTMDGYDAVVAAAKANADPPTSFAIAPAPSDKDLADGVMKTTADADIPKLALADREYVLQYASPENQAKVWDAFKGKAAQFPDVLVISSTPTEVQVAVSDGAVQDKKADYTFKLTPLTAPEEPKAKTPVALAAYKKAKAAYDKEVADDAAATAPGKTVTLQGTYESYTPNPIMIIMSDGAVVLPKAAPAKPSARRPTH
jgi:hypothetical protein